MFLLHSSSNDPYYNLALEEFLFEEKKEDVILIYINRDSIVCGKHQHVLGETNSRYVDEVNLPVLRRFSGGGTVYHDKGNINFSFITTGKDNKVIDFQRYAKPVVKFLKSLSVPAELTERHDITLEGFKISGHAAHAKNKRSLHHGTLLYEANLQKLSAALKSNPDKFKSRAVQSVRSRVANVQQYMEHRLDINEFVEMLGDHLAKEFKAGGNIVLSDSDREKIKKLAETKYKSFEWNFGYGPDYSFVVDTKIEDQIIKLELEVSESVFSRISVDKSTTFNLDWLSLTGKRHYWPDLGEILANLGGEDFKNQLIDHFF